MWERGRNLEACVEGLREIGSRGRMRENGRDGIGKGRRRGGMVEKVGRI